MLPRRLLANRLLKRKEGQKSNQMPICNDVSFFFLLYPCSILETFNHLWIKWSDLSQCRAKDQIETPKTPASQKRTPVNNTATCFTSAFDSHTVYFYSLAWIAFAQSNHTFFFLYSHFIPHSNPNPETTDPSKEEHPSLHQKKLNHGLLLDQDYSPTPTFDTSSVH